MLERRVATDLFYRFLQRTWMAQQLPWALLFRIPPPSVRRKVWPEALKREIVAAASVQDASVSVIARQYNVNTNLVFTWRRQFTRCVQTADAGFLPVVMQPEAAPSVAPSQVADAIEIELLTSYRLRVSGTTKASALRLVLDVLERR